MKEFDYIIVGGGCAGLSLAYELEINNKLKTKTLAIIETREEYKRDKTWSFWKVFDHNFEDCVIKSWNNFTINTSESFNELTNKMKVIAGYSGSIIYADSDETFGTVRVCDNNKAIKLLFYNPKINIEEGLKITYAWMNNAED